MITKILAVGNKVDITHAIKERQYKSKLLDIMDEEIIKISLPTEGSSLVLMEKGWRLLLDFYCEKGIYRCSGEIIDRYHEDKLYLIVVHITSELERIQRRQFYRLTYATEIRFRKLVEGEDKPVWEFGTTVDISGGGCRFNSKQEYEAGEQLEVIFFIHTKSGSRELRWQSIVTGCFRIPNHPKLYEIRIEFRVLDKKQREQLVRFIFEEERRVRQKERGLEA